MKRLNEYRMKMILFGFVAVIVLGSRKANADFTFSEPTNLGPSVNSTSGDWMSRVSHDGLELYLDSDRPGNYGYWDIYVCMRSNENDDWDTPKNLGPVVNSARPDGCASLSVDGLEMYFHSHNRSGGWGAWDIWVTKRESKEAPWSTPVNLGAPVNSSAWENCPSLSKNGCELYFGSNRSGGYGDIDVWVTKRATKNDPWGEPTNLGPLVNSSAEEAILSLSHDGLVLLFSEDITGPLLPGGYGREDLWATTRKSTIDPWSRRFNLGPIVNSSFTDSDPTISASGTTLYFTSNRPGGIGNYDLYQAVILPIVDFNRDLKVDSADMHIMVDNWGTDESLCDIGPMPWGDGIVDIQDMIVLAKHLYRLTAHWKLDETEGNIAYDSFGDNDGIINGNPLWQPTGGMKSGSLFLDGMDDYIDIPFILDPSEGSFSVFAWVYSWMPGQVIISQKGESGGTWLGIDSSGNLMTGFSDVNFGALESESFITDVQWHHVGFAYDTDTLHRRLYVDGILVAEDTSAIVGESSNDGLYIGASKDLAAGTLFSGFIDDVHVYKQALTTEEIAILAQ